MCSAIGKVLLAKHMISWQRQVDFVVTQAWKHSLVHPFTECGKQGCELVLWRPLCPCFIVNLPKLPASSEWNVPYRIFRSKLFQSQVNIPHKWEHRRLWTPWGCSSEVSTEQLCIFYTVSVPLATAEWVPRFISDYHTAFLPLDTEQSQTTWSCIIFMHQDCILLVLNPSPNTHISLIHIGDVNRAEKG